MLDRTPRRRPVGGAPISSRPPAHLPPARWPRACAAPPALAIGDPGTQARGLLDAATGAEVVLAGYDALDGALLARHRPLVVISHVLGRGFDALDLARRLRSLGFRGRYAVLADGLPCPMLVRREIADACPGLDVAMVVEGAPLRPVARSREGRSRSRR